MKTTTSEIKWIPIGLTTNSRLYREAIRKWVIAKGIEVPFEDVMKLVSQPHTEDAEFEVIQPKQLPSSES